MARVAKLNGTVLSRVEVGPGVAYNLSTAGEDHPNGSIRVTPEAFGKFLNSDSFVVPAVVVQAIQTSIELTDKADTPKGK